MRSKSVTAEVLASLTLSLVALCSAPVFGRDGAKEKELSPDNIQKQLQWEEKVVGPQNGKKIDHAKIAALQEQARKDEANRPKTAPKPAARPAGVAAPSTASLPTMDIEKPAPSGSVRMPGKKMAKAEAPKNHDAIDDFLAVNSSSDHPTGSLPLMKNDKGRRGAKHARRSRMR